MTVDITLPIALTLYGLGTVAVLAGLYNRSRRLQHLALSLMIGGFLSHTVWIGLICTRTGHPPLTNLPEIASFLGWTIFAVEFFIFIRFRVHAASFFVYPLVLMLLMVSAVIEEPFAPKTPEMTSLLFVGHLLLTTVGLAGLLIGLAFTLLYQFQDRSLKSKRSGRVVEWIPSLQVCEKVSYRALAIGFTLYTFGLMLGIRWAQRASEGPIHFGAKEIGAIVAWVFFATLLQSSLSGTFRAHRNVLIAGAAFVSIIIALLGIHHA